MMCVAQQGMQRPPAAAVFILVPFLYILACYHSTVKTHNPPRVFPIYGSAEKYKNRAHKYLILSANKYALLMCVFHQQQEGCSVCI